MSTKKYFRYIGTIALVILLSIVVLQTTMVAKAEDKTTDSDKSTDLGIEVRGSENSTEEVVEVEKDRAKDDPDEGTDGMISPLAKTVLISTGISLVLIYLALGTRRHGE